MKQFRMKYHLWSTNNSSKNENSNGRRALHSEQVNKSMHNQVNYTSNEPVSRDKTALKLDSKDTSPHCDDEWLELYRVQSEHSEGELSKNSESYHEISSRHFITNAINESFSEESDTSLNFQSSLTTESDNVKAIDSLPQMMETRDANLVHQPITPASDLKAVVVLSTDDLEIKTNTWREISESNIQLPSLDTLPMKHVIASSHSSVLSFSSLNGSTEDENSAADNEQASQSESFIEIMNSFDIRSNAEANSLSFNKFENVSDQETERGSQQSQFSTSNLKRSSLNEIRNSSSHEQKLKQMSSEATVMNQIALNEKLSLKRRSINLSSDDDDILENVDSPAERIENNLNVNNIINENSKKHHLEALPPLPPNRRTRGQSQSSVSITSIENKLKRRSTTPPPSYQRNELMLTKTEENDSDDSQHKHQKSCFPYPSLVRFPPPRLRKRTESIEEEEEQHLINQRKENNVKPKQDGKEANLIAQNSDQPPATRIWTEDVSQINTDTNKQEHSTDQETVTPQTPDQQVVVETKEITPVIQEQVTNSFVADGDDLSTENNSCDKQVLSCCTLL